MTLVLTVIRISFLIFSLYGYAVFFEKKLHFHNKVSWMAACTWIILVLYIMAYFGWLYYSGIGLFIIGCISAIYYLYQKRREGNLGIPKLNTLTLWLTFYFLMFSLTLLHTSLEHYDNFSHWALIVKFLYTEGSLPTANDAIIGFTSYPMGSSLFVYYATLIGGFDDSIMLIGQLLLLFSCIYALFAVVRDERRVLIITMMFCTIAIFNYFNIAIRMNNLLVDFILPMLTLAGIAGIYRMQRNLSQISTFLFLIAASLSLVKSSAMFFAVILIIYYLSRVIMMWRFRKSKLLLLGITLITIICSLLPSVIWNAHVKNTFPESKHEVSVPAYQQIFGNKDFSIIKQITDLFISTIADISTISTQGILLVNLVMFTIFIIIRFGMKRKNSLFRYLLIINIVIIIYYIGIYLMFLFSMPTEEALYLAGFDRYASSIIILALGVCMMVLAREIDYSFFEQTIEARSFRSFKSLRTKKWYQYTTLILLFFATLLLLSENNGMRYNNIHFFNSTPSVFSNVTDNQMTLNQTHYLVVTPDKEAVDSYLVNFVGRYFLYSPNVEGKEDFIMDDQPFIDLLNE
ncbi:hypothetical protein [Oceanobacillus sojae]|uniref:hypothetical protein n=1 Tax=Oceanobacillus sojae TaxID=582851 RepID=UPI0021A80271|nr:hypothetical protein [Oceanobacillus sojae]MCT1902555.1 hypothetical protein [Oceanobacillus sojae]